MSYLTPAILLGSVTVGSRCYVDTVTNGLVLCEEGLFGFDFVVNRVQRDHLEIARLRVSLIEQYMQPLLRSPYLESRHALFTFQV